MLFCTIHMPPCNKVMAVALPNALQACFIVLEMRLSSVFHIISFKTPLKGYYRRGGYMHENVKAIFYYNPRCSKTWKDRLWQ